MEKYFNIGEVAESLNVPESTLRYWQEKEIFDVSVGDNNYRRYTLNNLLDIAEISFYRNIGMSIKQMNNFHSFTLSDYEKILKDVRITLEEKIQAYNNMYESVMRKANHIQTIKELREIDFKYGVVPFNNIVKFDYDDKEKLKEYAKNPSMYVRYINTHDFKDEVRSIIVLKPDIKDTLVWKKKDDKKYAIFLIEENASENYSNNIAEKLEMIQKSHQTGILLAQFLLSETIENTRIDYLQGYVEIE